MARHSKVARAAKNVKVAEAESALDAAQKLLQAGKTKVEKANAELLIAKAEGALRKAKRRGGKKKGGGAGSFAGMARSVEKTLNFLG